MMMGTKIISAVLLQCLFAATINATILGQQTVGDAVVSLKRTTENGKETLVAETRKRNEQNDYVIITSCISTLDVNQTGWDQFLAWTNVSYPSEETAYYVGYNEGAMFPYFLDIWRNTVENFCDDRKEICNKIRGYIRTNQKWVSSMISAHKHTDEYWWQVGLVYTQINGIVDGYHSWKEKAQPNLTIEDFYFMHMRGELLDLVNVFSEPGSRNQYTYEGLGSAVVKLLPGNKDLLVGHNSWFGYNTLNRMGKRYELYHTVKPKGSKKLIPGRITIQSGYPGNLYSVDDFYVTSANLSVLETSIQNYNEDLWKNVNPKGSVLEYVRTLVANRLATDGKSWSEIFSKFNSGTYNNQWMVVDYKKFTPGQSPRDGLLWVVEQIPSLVKSSDETAQLKQSSYWPSYNIPYNKDVYHSTHHDKMAAKHGSWFSYDKSPRAEIFKRDHENIHCVGTLLKFLRSNDYKHDEHAKCKCVPPRDAANAIAARNDLNAKHGSYPFPQLARYPGGAIDAKAINASLVKNQMFVGISGPTTGTDLPVFRWSRSDYRHTVPHHGQCDSWNFGPRLFNWIFKHVY